METISVFYSTTEDEASIKYFSQFKDIASAVGDILNVHLHVIYWRELAGGLGDSGQSVIDANVADKYQIYVGIMGSRFGEGTAHEYEKAVRAHIDKGKPNVVFFGFCEEKVNPFDIEPDKLSALLEFRKDIAGHKFGRPILYFTFADEQTYRQRIQTNLSAGVKTVLGRTGGKASYGLMR